MLRSIFGFKPKTNQQSQTQITDITPRELQERLANESLLILDVRSSQEYATGHIVGSQLLPLPELRQHSQTLPKNQPIVCVCRSGMRSKTACKQLAKLGFTDLINLSGGMIRWGQADLSIQK